MNILAFILLIVFAATAFVILVKLLSSIVKGCLSTVLLVLLLILVISFVRSLSRPVNLFDKVEIDNLHIRLLGDTATSGSGLGDGPSVEPMTEDVLPEGGVQ